MATLVRMAHTGSVVVGGHEISLEDRPLHGDNISLIFLDGRAPGAYIRPLLPELGLQSSTSPSPHFARWEDFDA